VVVVLLAVFFFSSRRRHTRLVSDWSSDVCSSDLERRSCVRPSEFRWVSGNPVRFRSSAKARRSFCAHCGTQLTFQGDDYPDEIDVTTCSLDPPEAAPPRDHTYAGNKLSWAWRSDRLAQYPQAREQQ